MDFNEKIKNKRELHKYLHESTSKKPKIETHDPKVIQYYFYECEECPCPFKTTVDYYKHMIGLHGYTKFKTELDKVKDSTGDQYSNHEVSNADYSSDDNSFSMGSKVKESHCPGSNSKYTYSDSENFRESESKQKLNDTSADEVIASDNIGSYMVNLADELLGKNINVPILNISDISNAFPEIDAKINEENENILRDILIERNDESCDLDSNGSKEEELKLYELIKAYASIPRTVVEIKRSIDDFMVKILKKQAILNKANKKISKQVLAEEKKENDLTWINLTEIENSIENSVESQLRQDIFDVDQMSDITEIYDETQDLKEEEINMIIDKCSSRTVFNIELDETSDGWPTILGDVNTPSLQVTKGLYECHVCQEWSSLIYFDFYSHLKDHLISFNINFSKQRRQCCTVCGYEMPSSDLRKHMMKHNDHIRCSICQEFVAISDIETHKNVHSKHFMCGICGDLYKTKAAINRHLLYHKKGSEYSCGECSSRFAGLEKLVRHISHKHKYIDPNYGECPYCLNLTCEIKNHLYSADVCKLKCKVCSEVEKSNEGFITHMKGHNADNIKRVIKVVTGNNFVDCPDCNVKLSNDAKLRCHKICHHVNKLYSKNLRLNERSDCDICGTTMLKSHYGLHMAKHDTNDRCYICFKFVLKDGYKDHMDSHDLDHNCNLCGQQFLSEDKMLDHRFAHGRIVGHPCSDCELNFCSELYRAKHISLIHKKIDPEFVECYFCKELIGDKIEYHLFDYNVCLRRCKLCHVRFKSEDSLLRHVLKIHCDLIDLSLTLDK